MKVAILVTLAILAWLGLKTAVGHEAPRGWVYGLECCSDRDCAPIPEKNVKPIEGGNYLLNTGEIVGPDKIKRSQDEDYHLCRSPHSGHIFCLYVPPMGS